MTVWRTCDGSLVSHRHSGVSGVAFGPGDRLVALIEDESVVVLSLQDLSRIAVLSHTEEVSQILFDRSGRLLSCCGQTVSIWDLDQDSPEFALEHGLDVLDAILGVQTEQILTIQRAVELLAETAVTNHDNPHVPEEADWIPDEAQERIQAWAEAPLLAEIAVNAGYRATLVNLGLAGVSYHRLDEYVRARGAELCGTLEIEGNGLEHMCRAILDEMRRRGALSRPMLRYHPSYIAYPAQFYSAEWERRSP